MNAAEVHAKLTGKDGVGDGPAYQQMVKLYPDPHSLSHVLRMNFRHTNWVDTIDWSWQATALINHIRGGLFMHNVRISNLGNETIQLVGASDTHSDQPDSELRPGESVDRDLDKGAFGVFSKEVPVVQPAPAPAVDNSTAGAAVPGSQKVGGFGV